MKAGGGSRWTMLIWGGAALLLSVPFLDGFTSEVNWSASDFVVMGTLLAVTCGISSWRRGAAARIAHKLGVIVAVAAAS